MWNGREPLEEQGLAVLRAHRASLAAREANRYLYVRNDPLNSYDVNGLNPAVGVCIIGVAAAPIEVPVGAIIVGTAVVAGVAVITWQLCKHLCNRPEICPLTGQMDQPPIGDPVDGLGDGGYTPPLKICIYGCPKHGVVRQYYPEGTKCPLEYTYPNP